MPELFDQAVDTLEHIPVGVFVLDPEGRYLYVNKEYCDMIQRPRSFFEGMSVAKLKEMGFVRSSIWEQVVEKQQPVVSCITVTDAKSTRSYDTLAIGIPRFDGEGKLKSIICRQEEINKLIEYLQAGTLNKAQFLNPYLLSNSGMEEENFIVQSPQMKQIVDLLTTVSDTDVSILIVGASGVGKEVLAKHVHRTSSRSKAPMVTINCAAIPESLLESELFGYARGAFTGASKEGKPGLIEAAAGGTLFLDEINSMPLSTQTKLLRVLETKQVTRIGAVEGRSIDFRLICASNEDMKGLVNQKLFREDLFYRINVISVSIPPLKERREDIVPLALYFMDRFCKKHGRVKALPESVLNEIQQYEWPGNVRELRNAIERAIVVSGSSEWEITDLNYDAPAPARDEGPEAAEENGSGREAGAGQEAEKFTIPDGDGFSLKAYIDECERKLFASLQQSGKTAAEIADLLNISRSSVFRKLKKCAGKAPPQL